MEKIKWRDHHWLKYLNYFAAILFLFFAYSIFQSQRNLVLLEWIIIVGVVGYSIFGAIGAFLTHLTYVTESGIMVGNAQDDTYYRVNLPKPMFLTWNEIKTISFQNKVLKQGWFSFLKPFLLVSTKSNRTYTTFISNPSGFKLALKSLNREKLIVTESKSTK